MRTGKRIGVLAVCAGALLAIGASPRYLEELRVGGGYGDVGSVNSPAGGVDLCDNGDVSADGDGQFDGDLNSDGALSQGGVGVATTDTAVLKTLFDAQTVLQATADNTPVAVTIGEQTLVGRVTGGNITALTPAQARTLIDYGSNGLTFNDNVKALFGTGSDASIYYDGTDMIIDPKEVGSGVVDVQGALDVDLDLDVQGGDIDNSAGDFLSLEDTLYVDSVSGRAGIGTASPDHTLEATGIIKATPAISDSVSADRAAMIVAGSLTKNLGGTNAPVSGLWVTTTLSPFNSSPFGRSIYGIYANLGTMTAKSAAANNNFADIGITPATTALPGGANVAKRMALYIDSAAAGGLTNYHIYAAGDIPTYFGGDGQFAGADLTLGSNADADSSITFDGDTSDGVLNYDEDNAEFEFDQDVVVAQDARIAGVLAATTISVFTADDTTPSVAGGNIFKASASHTAGNNTTAFDDGVTGQVITVIANDTDYGIADGASMHLAGGVGWAPDTTNDTVQLVYDGSAWYEISRSDN